MSLSPRIAAALDDVKTETGPAGLVSAEEGPHRVSMRVRQVNSIAVESDELVFETSSPRSLDDLNAWADRLACRVTYLLEPLALLESDATGTVVELRSRKPAVRSGVRSYDEVRLDATGQLRLTRHAFEETTRTRRQTPFTLSREVLERLVEDLETTA
ncbi:MAG TPA: hypothetical protein VFT74_09675 [Isosphaeraceae bacterium]|nr:hypothetical protein [Isosphaeraceae bacterium]